MKIDATDAVAALSELVDAGFTHDFRIQNGKLVDVSAGLAVNPAEVTVRMILTHIEVDPSFRGSGLGARFAAEVFEEIETRSHEIRLTCPFLRKVGGTRANWRKKFNLGD